MKHFDSSHSHDPEKHERGRIPIHDLLSRAISRKLGASLLLMPGSGIEEIEVAAEHGFDVEDMLLVDDSPAVLANCTRKLKKRYPGIDLPVRKACLLSQACWHWARRDGYTVDAASLDFTGNLESSGAWPPRPRSRRSACRAS